MKNVSRSHIELARESAIVHLNVLHEDETLPDQVGKIKALNEHVRMYTVILREIDNDIEEEEINMKYSFREAKKS